MRRIVRTGCILVGLAIAAILVALILAISKTAFDTVQKPPATTTAATAVPTVAPTAIRISGTALVAAFDANKLAAQHRFTGRVVQTNGYITNISGVLGSYYVSLQPSADQSYFGTTMQASFADDTQLLRLVKGQFVTLRCTMQDMFLGLVEMQDCRVVA